jgi:hypothetical protein
MPIQTEKILSAFYRFFIRTLLHADTLDAVMRRHNHYQRSMVTQRCTSSSFFPAAHGIFWHIPTARNHAVRSAAGEKIL